METPEVMRKTKASVELMKIVKMARTSAMR